MDAELISSGIKVVTSDHPEWEERRQRWNLFSEADDDESSADVRIIVVPKNQDEIIQIVNWARKYNQTDIGVRSG
eukprot:1365654-Ditylum_brightwellii.AAC.1